MPTSSGNRDSPPLFIRGGNRKTVQRKYKSRLPLLLYECFCQAPPPTALRRGKSECAVARTHRKYIKTKKNKLRLLVKYALKYEKRPSFFVSSPGFANNAAVCTLTAHWCEILQK
eukprot:GEMP01077592.1.p1 GENE.GEMP01077592.1~~GEMP01077592.1.p1  ORF type:complete len:115 (+),score=13.23 GEMP01077592.1:579-923(+)